MAKGRLTDPVDSAIENDLKMVDLSKIEMKPMTAEVVRVERPFDGYPLKYTMVEWPQDVRDEKGKVITKMVDGKRMLKLCMSHLVAHNHVAFPVKQDPSNRKRIKTYHNRSVRDVANGPDDNVSVWFDIPVKLSNGTFYCAIVPDHYVRAQLCFKYNDKTKRVEIDTRYGLVDLEQENRLQRVFKQIIAKEIAREERADFITAPKGQEGIAMPEFPESAEQL